MVKLALLSVSDKRGLVEFATVLVRTHGYTLLSTGGTAKLLAERGLPVTEAKAGKVISLPMHPYLDAATQDQIIEAVRGFNG